jgi:hypothetical protein
MHPGPKTFYKSRLIGKISSGALEELKENLRKASRERADLIRQLHAQQKQLKRLKLKRRWLGWFPLSKVLGDKVSEWDTAIAGSETQVRDSKQKLQKCKVEIEIELAGNMEAAFGALYHAYSQVQQSDRIWDITTSQKVDRVALRTAADHAVDRKLVRFGKTSLDIVSCDYEALHLQNANGADLYIYPLFIVMRDERELALIDLRDVDLHYSQSGFVEEETVPEDAELVGHTWAKTNKDGSRDKRYKNNCQIPILKYGQIHLETEQGLNEVYMVSNADALLEFASIFDDYKEVLTSA